MLSTLFDPSYFKKETMTLEGLFDNLPQKQKEMLDRFFNKRKLITHKEIPAYSKDIWNDFLLMFKTIGISGPSEKDKTIAVEKEFEDSFILKGPAYSSDFVKNMEYCYYHSGSPYSILRNIPILEAFKTKHSIGDIIYEGDTFIFFIGSYFKDSPPKPVIICNSYFNYREYRHPKRAIDKKIRDDVFTYLELELKNDPDITAYRKGDVIKFDRVSKYDVELIRDSMEKYVKTVVVFDHSNFLCVEGKEYFVVTYDNGIIFLR